MRAFDELLEDQIVLINFETINRRYAANETWKEEIMKQLTSLPETAETNKGTIKVLKLLAVL